MTFKYEVLIDSPQELELIKQAVEKVGAKDFIIHDGSPVKDYYAHLHFTCEQQLDLSTLQSYCRAYWVKRVDKAIMDEEVVIDSWRKSIFPEREFNLDEL